MMTAMTLVAMKMPSDRRQRNDGQRAVSSRTYIAAAWDGE